MPFHPDRWLRNDSPADLRRQVIALSVGSSLCVLAVACWAFWPFSPTPSSDAVVAVADSSPVAAARPVPADWPTTLWVPLHDQADVATAATTMRTQLFSIVQQDGATIAVLDLQDGKDLIYARPGETVQGMVIQSIDANGVVLQVNGQSQRLDLAR